MRTSDSGYFNDKRTNGPGWLYRWTPPTGRSSLRCVQAYSVRLLPQFLSTTAKYGADPIHSVSEALTSITTSELEGTAALMSMSSPAHRVSTLPPVPLALGIPAAGTPVGQPFFTLALGLKCKKWDGSQGSIPEDQSDKRAHTGTEVGSVNSGCSTLPTQPVASHSPEQPEPELVNLLFQSSQGGN